MSHDRHVVVHQVAFILLDHFVAREGERAAQAQRPVLVELLVVDGRKVDAVRFHTSDIAVGRNAQQARRRRQRGAPHEDARTVFGEVGGFDVQRVEQSQFETDVEFLGLLPRRVGVAVGGDLRAFALGVPVVVESRFLAHGHDGAVGEALAQGVVARQTVRYADLQVADRLADAVPERLVGDHPAGRRRGEETPAFAGSEVLRAVVAEAGLEQVAVVESVGHAACHALLAVGQQVLLARAGDVVLLLVHAVDEHGSHVVFAEFAGVVQRGLQRVAAVAAVAVGAGQVGRARVADRVGDEIGRAVGVERTAVLDLEIIGGCRAVGRRIGVVVE